MRIWRALKGNGSKSLRDGVYILPCTKEHQEIFRHQAREVEHQGGSAWILRYQGENEEHDRAFCELFDRSDDYRDWQIRLDEFCLNLSALDEPAARRQQNQLRRDFERIEVVDFYPGEAKVIALQSMQGMEESVNQHFSPGEPLPQSRPINLQDLNSFKSRIWATRSNLWVDRVCSAWLIQRFVDPDAKFLWLDDTDTIPEGAVGFDFDDANFAHVDDWVTFEVLLKSFGLDANKALMRIAEVVHYLDVGGEPAPDAPGFLTMLSGARSNVESDNQFLEVTGQMLDMFYSAYQRDNG